MIYVISDLHGEYELFDKMLKKISFKKGRDHMYILGDVVDRGINSIKLLERIMNNSCITLIRGNHEEAMIKGLQSGCGSADIEYWLNIGGTPTYEEFMLYPKLKRDEMLRYLENTPIILNIHINRINYVLVHAGVMTRKDGRICKTQDTNYCLWAKGFYDSVYVRDSFKYVIFGHTPTTNMQDGEPRIWHSSFDNKIGIDCGSFFTGKIGCLRLDDMREFYIEKEDF